MGKVRIGKVKGVSNELVNKYGDVFTTDFETNKKLVAQYSDITSKRLNNRVAGYITRLKVNEKKRAEAEAAEAAEIEGTVSESEPVAEAGTEAPAAAGEGAPAEVEPAEVAEEVTEEGSAEPEAESESEDDAEAPPPEASTGTVEEKKPE